MQARYQENRDHYDATISSRMRAGCVLVVFLVDDEEWIAVLPLREITILLIFLKGKGPFLTPTHTLTHFLVCEIISNV